MYNKKSFKKRIKLLNIYEYSNNSLTHSSKIIIFIKKYKVKIINVI